MPIPKLHNRPRYGRGWKERLRPLRPRRGGKSRWTRLALRWALPIFGIGVFLLGLTGVAVFAWYSRDLPDPNKINDRHVAQSTKIFARDGTTLLYDLHGDEKRTVISLSDIPEHVRQETIVIEDRDFYKHAGFSFTGFLRSAWVNVTSAGQRRPGGSTITQQFVKNAILTSEKSFTRKVKELILSYQIERRFTKDQILQLYFNQIPYGANNYGIEAASQSFFGKSVKELSLDEGALLAALPQRPSFLSPYGSHTDDLLWRQRYILDEMARLGYVPRDQAEAAKQVDILKKVRPKREAIRAPHFVFFVQEYLAAKFGENILEQGGLQITTTLDIEKQTVAEEEIAAQSEKNLKQKATNAALVALDPKTGEILAMVGSRDYFDVEHDGNVNVTIRPRQPGSSFKPVVYATAFKKGYTPDTLLFDLVTTFKTDSKDYVPHNYTNKEYGLLTMRKALAGSLNIPAVKTLYLAGIGTVLDQAEAMGYTTFGDRSRFGLSLVLGGGEVKLLEHTGGFAVFAADGVRHPTVAVKKIVDERGKVLEEFKPSEGNRVLDGEIARQVTSILSDNDARSFIFGGRNFLTLGGRPVAAKTGTTNDFRDAWTVGYTPSLAAGVWVGNNNNDEMGRGADGSVVAAPIWNRFMGRVLKGTPVERFPAPKPVTVDKPILKGKIEGNVKVRVDKITGKKIPDSCTDYPKAFVVEKELMEAHTILFYVDKDNPRGPPPKNPSKDPQFATWEAAVQRWVGQHPEYAPTTIEQERCDLRSPSNLPTVSFTQPTDGQTVAASASDASVTVSSPRAIANVRFFLDDAPIGNDATAPFAFTVPWSTYALGAHQLRADATDDVGNVGSATVAVTLQPVAAAQATLTAPEIGASLPASSFPLTLRAMVSHPSGIVSVSFFVSDGVNAPQLIAQVANPAGSTVETSWSGLPPGTYQLFVQGGAVNGEAVTSALVSITIVP